MPSRLYKNLLKVAVSQSLVRNWVQPEGGTTTMPAYPQTDEEAELLFRQAYELSQQGQYAEARAAYEKAVHLQPDYVEAWYYLGSTLEKLHHYKQAFACYDKVVCLEPLHQYAWYRRGVVLLTKLQRYDEAIVSYDKATQIQPDDYDSWYGLGDTLMQLKQYSEAVTSYKKAIDINPTNCWDWSERVLKLQELQKGREALSVCNQVTTSLENLVQANNFTDSWAWDSIHQAWYVLGNCLLGLHFYEEAVNACNKAIKIKPDEGLSWYCLALALEKLQRYEEAAKCFDQAIEIQPNFQEANKGRERVQKKISS